MGKRRLRTIASALFAGLCAGQLAYADPILWVGDQLGKLGTVDVATGTVSVVGSMGSVMTDIAFSPTGNLYGVDLGNFYSINATTGVSTLIGSLGTSVNSLVFDASGTLYAANKSLYTINVGTGAATLVGNGGTSYSSSGDLAFVGGNLYLSSVGIGDNLMRLDSATGVGTLVGSIGFSSVFGLATDNNINLYGMSGTQVINVNVSTGAGSLLLDYGGKGLGAVWGSAFVSEAAPPVGAIPEPEIYAMLSVGLGLIGWVGRRKKLKESIAA